MRGEFFCGVLTIVAWTIIVLLCCRKLLYCVLLREKTKAGTCFCGSHARRRNGGAVRDGQPLLRDKNLGKGYGGQRGVYFIVGGVKPLPKPWPKIFRFSTTRGTPCCVGSDASNTTE